MNTLLISLSLTGFAVFQTKTLVIPEIIFKKAFFFSLPCKHRENHTRCFKGVYLDGGTTGHAFFFLLFSEF